MLIREGLGFKIPHCRTPPGKPPGFRQSVPIAGTARVGEKCSRAAAIARRPWLDIEDGHVVQQGRPGRGYHRADLVARLAERDALHLAPRLGERDGAEREATVASCLVGQVQQYRTHSVVLSRAASVDEFAVPRRDEMKSPIIVVIKPWAASIYLLLAVRRLSGMIILPERHWHAHRCHPPYWTCATPRL